VVDRGDAADLAEWSGGSIRLHAADTRIADADAAARFAQWLVDLP
jgi:hypothetical protein